VTTLINDRKSKSVSLCQNGLARGSRLISDASVCEFLEGLAAAQQNPQERGVMEGMVPFP
jgi:hypothetical protein